MGSSERLKLLLRVLETEGLWSLTMRLLRSMVELPGLLCAMWSVKVLFYKEAASCSGTKFSSSFCLLE